MNRELLGCKQRTKNLVERIDAFYGDPELQSDLARLLCISVCGFLENCLRLIYSEYAQLKSHPNIGNYVENQLDGFHNPNMEKILTLAGSFCPKWRKELEEFTKERIKASVDSLVANRHLLAHGESVGITVRAVKRQYEDVLELVNFIQRQCGI
jgi:hypothetical protein